MSEEDFIEFIRIEDEHLIATYVSKLNNNWGTKDLASLFHTPNNPNCSISIAQHLRELSWGIKIEGITMPPPHEQMSMKRWKDANDLSKCFLIQERKCVTTPNCTRGPLRPYIGSATTLRKKRSNLEVIVVDDMLKNILNLNLVKWWVTHNPSSNLASLIKSSECTTDISLKNMVVMRYV